MKQRRTRNARRELTAESPVAKKKESTLEFIASIAGVLAVGLYIITFNVQAFAIPSGSMEDTLLVGDHVFVDRVRFAPASHILGPLEPYRPIKDGDIVVFLHPDPRQAGTYVVKRVIGVPGDHIRLRDGAVYRNGVALNEPYVQHCARENPACPYTAAYDPYRDNFPGVPLRPDDPNVAPYWAASLGSYIHDGELIVPPGRYFGMGDNRDVSLDSRFWGFIPQENVIGRPLFIYWSFKTSEEEMMRTSAADRVEHVAHVLIHFFDGTRWKRMARVVR